MNRETMPLRDAIGRLADMHEAERDRLKVWADEVAPQIAAKLGVPVDRIWATLGVHFAQHLDTLGEITFLEAADLASATVPPKIDAEKME